MVAIAMVAIFVHFYGLKIAKSKVAITIVFGNVHFNSP